MFTPLTIGELWALPTMLRIGILERLAAAVAAITGLAAPDSPNALPSLPAPSTLPNESHCRQLFSQPATALHYGLEGIL